MSNNQDLTYGDPDTFLGEAECMDLSHLEDKTFLVAVNTGAKNRPGFMPSTVRGPLTFPQMIDMVNHIYTELQLDAKVILPSSEWDKKNQYLDECTVDYIHANAIDLIAEYHLFGGLNPDKDFTCKAGTLVAEEDGKTSKRPEELISASAEEAPEPTIADIDDKDAG
jgi:hypothetical protein